MAYGQQNQGNRPVYGGNKPQAQNSKPPSETVPTSGAAPRKALFATGLFAPTREGVKSIGSVQVKEDVLIPAGSYINLYSNDERKTDKHPPYTIQVTAGKTKTA